MENKEEIKVKLNLNEKSQSRRDKIKERYHLLQKIKEERELDKAAEMIESQSR
jgi:hypothetical protein